MIFELLPMLDKMIEFYQKPRNPERFQEYLRLMLNDRKDEVLLPAQMFNPMGKEHILEKLLELKSLRAEEIMVETLAKINREFGKNSSDKYKVAFNLPDDLKGGWTNRFTTDYDSKFAMKYYLKNHFCLPTFWASESFTEKIITERTQEYARRTIFQAGFSQPKTLAEHLKQEAFSLNSTENYKIEPKILEIFQKNKDSEDFSVIFNFLYGDKIAAEIGYKTICVEEDLLGFKLAKELCRI